MPAARSRRLATAALALALLGAAGCSSDSGGSASPTTREVGATTTSAGAGDGAGGGEALARYADYESKEYDDPTHWVCRPDLADDICHGDLDSTTVEPDGTLTVVPFERAEDPPIDCFYVYPTISRDDTKFSDWEASPEEEGYVTLQQAARLASECRVFAPVYRQNTLTSLGSTMGGAEMEGDDIDPFQDVLDAFRTYLAEDNGGRGFVLLGHSQGAAMVEQLLKSEVDPNEDVRAQLVAAYVAGGSVAVPEGEVVGGDLDNVPLCTAADEAGCVVTWSTFRSTAPPPANSFFGRVADGEGVAGCVNPAAPEGGVAELDAYFPADPDASILASLGAAGEGRSWVQGDPEPIETPFVTLPGLVSGGCATTADGIAYLSATIAPDPSTPRIDDISGDLTPEWGLHLVDFNLVMGDVVSLVGRQAEAYAG